MASLDPAEGFKNRSGLGVEAIVDGHAVVVGRPAMLVEWGLELSPELATAFAAEESKGRTVVAAAIDGALAGLFVVADRIKQTSDEAIADLRSLGLTPVLLTGDNERAARAIADEAGIEQVIANVLPEDKSAVVMRLQSEGEIVAMVGDGVNDAPALAQADLGLAIGTGTDVAIEASDLTLVSGDLRAAVDAIRLARRTLRTIKGNLFWAFAYNVAAIPLAVAGLLNPIVAAAAMAFSSVFVVTNSLRLRRFHSLREETLMHGYAQDKELLVKRLHRIEGQVRGIERMIDEDRYCIDILTQIAAVKTALEQVGAKLLEGHVNHCVHDAIASGDAAAADEKTAELLDAVQRFVKTR